MTELSEIVVALVPTKDSDLLAYIQSFFPEKQLAVNKAVKPLLNSQASASASSSRMRSTSQPTKMQSVPMTHSQVKSLAINAEMKYSGLTNLLKDELHLIKENDFRPKKGKGKTTSKSQSATSMAT